MNILSNKFTIYLISHSHTDIGYTDRQEKITRYHSDFIKQVVSLMTDIENEIHPGWEGFRWTCENFWQVEQFLKNAESEQIDMFKHFVLTGKIDVSLNYLNMTELVDDVVLRKKLSVGRAWADSIGFRGKSALTADINGYSWGYSDALLDNGIQNLFSCVHGHHGLAPLRRQQRPFYWTTPSGNKILVWNGDHYMLGNEFLLIPNTRFTYHLKDIYENDNVTNQFAITKYRIFSYVNSLRNYGYHYDFAPVMISGVVSDNAPANGMLMDSINKWNNYYGEEIELKMITLNDFFDIVRTLDDIPTYSGDWNDWWADGVGSTPAATKIYKDAQRKYHLIRKLENKNFENSSNLEKDIEDNLMMYAEHTWGYSSSISEPWNTLVNELEFRKIGYATQAHVAASNNLDSILAQFGEKSISPERQKKYKIINPHDEDVYDVVNIFIEHWEHIDGKYINESNISNITVVDELGNVYPCQAKKTARATEIMVLIRLHPKEERELSVGWKEENSNFIYRLDLSRGSEGVSDIKDIEEQKPNDWRVETSKFIVKLDRNVGVSEIILKRTGESILNKNRVFAPFVGIYEKTPIRSNPVEERRVMGRNRKGIFVERYSANLTDLKIDDNGDVYIGVILDYNLYGTGMYSIYMRVFKEIERIDVTLRLHKLSEWAPENLYMSLPFQLEDSETYIDKEGCLIRPKIDQIPGTNMEFYLTQNGIVYKNKKASLFITLKDNPLVTFGDLDPHEIILSGHDKCSRCTENAYSWIMNNFWETNFKADLGGFYEFNYSIDYINKSYDSRETMEKFEQISEGLIGIPI